MAYKEPVIRNFFRCLTADPHHFQFQPDARYHTFLADIIRHLAHAVRETPAALFPLSDAVPPVAVRIPATVDAEIFASCLRRGIDQRKLRLCRRFSPQAVHVVIEYDRELFIVRVDPADLSAVGRQRLHRVIKSVCRHTDRHRNTGEAVARL